MSISVSQYPTRPIGRYQHRPMACLAIAALLGACATEPPPQDNAVVSLPRILTEVRAIDLDRLRLEVLVNNQNVNMTRIGDRWSGRIEISGEGDFPLVVNWFQNFPQGELQLAQSQTQTINQNSPPRVRVDLYFTGQFDQDNDGRSNIREVNEGTDPFTADPAAIASQSPASSADQGPTPCSVQDVANTPDVILTGDDNRSESLSSDDVVYSRELTIETDGKLTIRYEAGSQDMVSGLLYRADAHSDEAIVTTTRGSAAAGNAQLQADVSAGTYCVLLEGVPTAGAAETTTLANSVVSVRFEAD